MKSVIRHCTTFQIKTHANYLTLFLKDEKEIRKMTGSLIGRREVICFEKPRNGGSLISLTSLIGSSLRRQRELPVPPVPAPSSRRRPRRSANALPARWASLYGALG
ncbi:hypothetical protein [Mesorhizobium sp. YM1C-6-2]|uniref:hypothetical protein n=1 Tax=Mesorhizobium sp. YM1C-6-2 TaxID=1827501 RepID=UPI0011C3F546|nr:hypothetical protein [Mesorhizobium sp. YM1C-6-2]